ncbi:cupin-like domain-containing protein [Caulobacter sp. Root1472]|uniref:cupin-like domain-containing protein n=1 Tax=Caulobacter sp. Root1472 TaxID=1736470 RepID=UPI0006F1E4EB|nr:cupin-like domain-containing protein [Caulobacter sp. Root1472]KQZ33128.1 cupin [Caulobacter sp. Root1472]
MIDIARRTPVVEGLAAGQIPFDEILTQQRPTIFRGLARDWPLVRAGLASPRAAMDHLLEYDRGERFVAYIGAPEIKGRFGYDAEVSRLNFQTERAPLRAFLERVEQQLHVVDGPSFYIGSSDIDAYLPGLRAENDLGLDLAALGDATPLASIWIGNRTVAAAHYDMSNNIAVCAVGRRRFTLLPPEQVDNLYPGPLDPTPGGQAVSMVDFDAPDLARFPRFWDALAAAQVAELEPGDVLVYPALWWHQVEALDPFNVLVNYWWNAAPAFMDSPMNTLLHGLLSLRDRPDFEKQAWKKLFDYYVFGPADRAGAHLPEAARGDLSPLDERKARRLRAYLLNRLNR